MQKIEKLGVNPRLPLYVHGRRKKEAAAAGLCTEQILSRVKYCTEQSETQSHEPETIQEEKTLHEIPRYSIILGAQRKEISTTIDRIFIHDRPERVSEREKARK